MLLELTLSNFVIAKQLHVTFGRGFNVITGETGAGKTLLLQALSLLQGDRADYELIGAYDDMLFVQGAFEFSANSKIFTLLEKHKIQLSVDEPLMIRRELCMGKSKAYINAQLTTSKVLKEISTFLYESVSQNLQESLKSESFQTAIIDDFDEIQTLLGNYQTVFAEEKALEQKYNYLQKLDEDKNLIQSQLEKEYEELANLELSEESETHLFELYKSYQDQNDKKKLIAELIEKYSNNDQLLPMVNNDVRALEKFPDETFLELAQDFKNLQATMNNALEKLVSLEYELNSQENRLEELETTLRTMKSAKRKYGPEYEDVKRYVNKLEHELDELKNLDSLLYETSDSLAKTNATKVSLANELTKLRKQRANYLSKAVTKELSQLDMNHATFAVDIQTVGFGMYGQDRVTFRLKTNHQNKFGLLGEIASGGELARTLLAIKLSLNDQTKTATMIFDEIDANIGGETATKIAKKLKLLSQGSQIICITHFAQVANIADHHQKISKEKQGNLLLSTVKNLGEKEKTKELIRMMGGQQALERVIVNNHKKD